MSAEPSSWVVRFAPLLRAGGTVLDLAAGGGRHARFLAGRGLEVLAVDRDAAALATMHGVPGITTLLADLESAPWPLPGRRFDAVVVTSYLHRPLWPAITDALADGGVLLYETFAQGHERFGRPANPDFLLAPGELLGAFAGLTVLAFEQGCREPPEAAVVQRLSAVRGALPQSITVPGLRR